MEIVKYAVQGGSAAAVVAVVYLFMKELRSERQDRRAEREGFLKTIQNHMEHSTEATTGMKEATTGMQNAISSLENLLTGWLSGQKK